MGQKILVFKMPTDYSQLELRAKISKKLQLKNFDFQIENKSLDARNKRQIHWLLKVLVSSVEIKHEIPEDEEKLQIPSKKRNKKIIVVGSGPAGFFSAYVLQKAGFECTLIERGSDVEKRTKYIEAFERTEKFNAQNNYAFGEGGAGTFSDGKLISRSKHISKERSLILNTYVEAGAPDEIRYLAHPHLGSDNLRIMTKNLRLKFENLGGKILFDTCLNDVKIKDGNVKSIQTSSGALETDYLVLAIGHSAFDTYRMLIRTGVLFRTKNFAIGSRMEHPQTMVNRAQWGVESLAGVKAAEYRLTSKADGKHQVYSFCMCPGGMVVPATAFAGSNIVNGMSLYGRDAEFANAACVASVNLAELLKKEVSPLESLDWLEQLEKKFYDYSDSYRAPFCSIEDFLNMRVGGKKSESSYPLGLINAPLWEMLPSEISIALKSGLQDFKRKINGFERGILLGLESKTSSSIQVIRDRSGLCDGFENLFMLGEGSGYAGGIISSAADGVKGAMKLIEMES